MPKPPRPWIVTRHDPIVKHEDNLWSVAGDVPGLPIHRRMTIVRRSNGDLLFFNAVPLEERALDEIKAFGGPKMLVVPHDQHMIDARAFQQKLGLELYGPAACEAKMRERGELTGPLEAIPSDPAVRVQAVAGSKTGEAMLVVTSGSRVTVAYGDAIQNSPKAGLSFPLRLLGFGGGPKVVPVFKLLFTKDKAALSAQLRAVADTAGLKRLIPAHGTIVEQDAAGALRSAAEAV